MHSRKVYWVTLVMIVILVWSGIENLEAQTEEKVITMDKAVEMALKTNYSLTKEELSLENTRRNRNLAWNYFLPTITATGALSKPNEPSMLVPDRFSLGTRLDFSLAVAAPLFFKVRQTFLDYEAGLISRDLAKRKLDTEVRKSFLQLILLEENIKLIKKQIANAGTRYEQARANYRNGLIDEYSMLSAQVMLESLKPQLMDKENIYTSALLLFKLLIGVDLDDKISLKGSIEPSIAKLDVNKLLVAARENNPEIAIRELTIKGIDNNKKMGIAAFFPALAFTLNYDPTFNQDPFQNSWFADIDNDWAQRTGAFTLSISLPLHNLLPGSQAWQALGNIENELEKNKLDLQHLLEKTEVDIRLAVLRLKKSEEAIRAYQLSLDVAEKANAMGQLAYKAGLKDYSEIETTELKLDEAYVALLAEKYNYASGLLDLAFMINTSLDKVKE